MDLYDDLDTKPKVEGWSSGIKMLQTQMALKKAHTPKEPIRKPLMAPTLNIRPKRPANPVRMENVVPAKRIATMQQNEKTETHYIPAVEIQNVAKDEWDLIDEYDPQWPNEYEKIKEKQHSKDLWDERPSRRTRNADLPYEERDRKRRSRSGGLHHSDKSPGKNKEIDEDYASSSRSTGKKVGAAIAPPPSLQEPSLLINNENDSSSNVTIPYSASSVAAKIMAKYGFKDGQGLGKQEQGMSIALQVEKTSKRGGRIIHEKDVFLPPPTPSVSSSDEFAAPTIADDDEDKGVLNAAEPSITEIMKTPSKVVLLRNMVGPGDVDEELEPEVKDECNTKYGDVVNVVIHETFGTTPEDAVKIFVEFKRIESAIKAVVDLNGRFFGGRQVRAGFFDFDKFKKYQLH